VLRGSVDLCAQTRMSFKILAPKVDIWLLKNTDYTAYMIIPYVWGMNIHVPAILVFTSQSIRVLTVLTHRHLSTFHKWT
jgi:hypothetical protein